MMIMTNLYNPPILKEGHGSNTSVCPTHYAHGSDGIGNLVTLWYPGGPDSSMVEHLVQFQKGLGLSPGPVTFHAAINLCSIYLKKSLPMLFHCIRSDSSMCKNPSSNLQSSSFLVWFKFSIALNTDSLVMEKLAMYLAVVEWWFIGKLSYLFFI